MIDLIHLPRTFVKVRYMNLKREKVQAVNRVKNSSMIYGRVVKMRLYVEGGELYCEAFYDPSLPHRKATVVQTLDDGTVVVW